MIIIEIRQDVKQYFSVAENDRTFLKNLLAKERPQCPECGNCMHIHSKYLRRFVFDEAVVNLEIYRLRCCECKKVHAVLPEFVAPYRIEPIEVVQSVCESEESNREVADKLQDVDERTILRWRTRYEKMKLSVLSTLQGIYAKVIGKNYLLPVGNCLQDVYESIKGKVTLKCLWGKINCLLTADSAGIWL